MKLIQKDARGASLVEHGMLLGLVAVVAIGAVSSLGGEVRGTFEDASAEIADTGVAQPVAPGSGGSPETGTPPTEEEPPVVTGPAWEQYASYVDEETFLFLTEGNDVETIPEGVPGVFADAGNDTITGSSAGQVFIGGAGDDSFSAGSGNSVYVYALGDGNDLIDDYRSMGGDSDMLDFIGLNADDVVFRYDPAQADLTVTMSDGAVVTVRGNFHGFGHGLMEAIAFSDTTLARQAQLDKAAQDAKAAGDPIVYGGSLSTNHVHASSVDGAYTIDDYKSNGGDGDKLTFVEDAADDIVFRIGSDYTDLLITTPDGDEVKIEGSFTRFNDRLIETIAFADSTSLNREGQLNKAAEDAKDAGDPVIYGTTHSTAYFHTVLEDGSYTIDDYKVNGGDSDSLTFTDATSSQVTFRMGSNYTDMSMTTSDGDVILINRHILKFGDNHIETIAFSDNVSLTRQGQINKAAADAKNAGDAVIYGGFFSTAYTHTMATDGSYMIDDYKVNGGDSDSLIFTDVNYADVTFANLSGDLLITLPNATTVRLRQQLYGNASRHIETLTFQDGAGGTFSPTHQQQIDKAAADAL